MLGITKIAFALVALTASPGENSLKRTAAAAAVQQRALVSCWNFSTTSGKFRRTRREGGELSGPPACLCAWSYQISLSLSLCFSRIANILRCILACFLAVPVQRHAFPFFFAPSPISLRSFLHRPMPAPPSAQPLYTAVWLAASSLFRGVLRMISYACLVLLCELPHCDCCISSRRAHTIALSVSACMHVLR